MKFKVGDRVVGIGFFEGAPIEGHSGVVIDVVREDDCY